MLRKLAFAVLALGLSCWFRTVRADTRAFSAGSLIIPMDACNQATSSDPLPSYGVNCKTGDDGAVKAYGLVYMLLKRGITVYISINPNKTTIADIDMSLTHAGGVGAPVGVFNRSTEKVVNFTTQNTMNYRGAPFIVDVNDAPSVLNYLVNDPLISAFTSVAVHIAYDNFQAPVAARMNGVPPRVAVFAPPVGQDGTQGTEHVPLMEAYLNRAGLNYPGAIGQAGSPGDIFDVLTTQDIGAGALAGNYQAAWLPHYDAAGTQADAAALAQFANFAANGGLIFAECGSIQSFESNPITRFMTATGIVINALNSCYPGDTRGWNAHDSDRGGYDPTLACFDPVPPITNYGGALLSFTQPANVFSQIGDFPFFKCQGEVEDWNVPPPAVHGKQHVTYVWNAGVQHLIQSSDASASLKGYDVMSMTYLNNDPTKGQIIYFGGHFYGDVTAPQTAGIRIVLNTLLFANPNLFSRYIARSGATLATVDGTTYLFQGTYLENNATIPAYSSAADLGWPFPQVLGHYRAYDVSQLALGQVQALSDSTALLWDAASLMPAAAKRTLYTSQGSGAAARLVPLSAVGLTELGVINPFALPSGYVAADQTTLLQKIQMAPLGGINHSTSAIIGPQSLVVGGAGRPTTAYVGASDGMLHAFLVGGESTPAGLYGPYGTEMWGFLPGEQLANVRTNAAALDGSPNVSEIFEQIGGGPRTWRTLLTIPTGALGTAIYGLDVSNPQVPSLLWESGTAGSGVLLGNASASAQAILPAPGNPFQSEVVVASSVPTGAAGIAVTTLWGASGAQLWQWSHAYTRLLPGTPAVVPNDLPAPAVLGQVGGSAYVNRVYEGDLEGRIWELDALSGTNLNGTSPLADVGLTQNGNVQPIGVSPTLYVDQSSGHLILLVVTGGMDWASQLDTYGVYAFDLDPRVRHPDVGSGVAPELFYLPFAYGLKGYSRPTVNGDDVYLLASAGILGGSIGVSLNDTATLMRINLKTKAVNFTMSLTKGAGAFLGTSDGIIYGSTAQDLVAANPTGADMSGTGLNPNASPVTPRLWLEPL